MFGTTVKVKKELLAKLRKHSEASGYSSPEEFLEHLIEKEVARLEESESDAEIARKLKGLGYLE